MRFKKGSKVEVSSKRDMPPGSWWCAEIISGNGHTYYVKYDGYPAYMGAAIDRVPRKAIRPCPPQVKPPRNWIPGDIVEVLDNYSWKLAEVSRIGGRKHIFVRLLGSSMDFRARLSGIRPRQCWEDDKWVFIGMDSGKSNDGPIYRPSTLGRVICQMPRTGGKEKNYALDNHFTVNKDKVVAGTSQIFKEGTKKRPHVCLLPLERCTGAGKKLRALEKGGRHQRLVAGHSPRFHEKVDAVASPQIMLGEKYMHASLNNRTTGFYEIQRGEGITNADDDIFFRIGSEPCDTESVTSSVGSCSPSSSPYRSLYYPVNGPSHDLDSCSFVVGASFGSGREPSLPENNELAEEIHRLELHAYRTTMVALYASGPISWDQEALMTNLRLMLHITNDEHLSELRNLISAEKGASFR